MRKVITIVLAVLIVVGGGGYLLAQGADAAEPGDTLYSVDLLSENIQRLLTFDELKRTELETSILDERMAELEDVLGSEDVNLEEVLSTVSAQQDRVREHIGTLEANADMYQSGELEQIRNQYQEKLQEHIQVMEKVQNQGEEGALQIKQNLETDLQNCQSGNCNTTSGSSTENGNGNGGSTEDNGNQGGNEDAGNSGDNGNGGTSGSSGQGGNPNN